MSMAKLKKTKAETFAFFPTFFVSRLFDSQNAEQALRCDVVVIFSELLEDAPYHS
jgi:hypothetical protein